MMSGRSARAIRRAASTSAVGVGWPMSPSRRPVVVLELLVLHVLRDVEQDRPGPPFPCHGEHLVHRLRQLLDVFHQPVVLGDRLSDADDVRLLESIAADHGTRHLSGDRH
jgi:hypothetical protein